jgi:hypothetical protein
LSTYGPLSIKIGTDESAIVALESRELAELTREVFSSESRIFSDTEILKEKEVLEGVKEYKNIVLFNGAELGRYLRLRNKAEYNLTKLLFPNKFIIAENNRGYL